MSHRLHTLRMENDEKGYRMEEMRPRFQALAARHETGTAPRAVSAYQLFQTPPELAARLVRLLDLTPGVRLLEPSAGLGRLLDALQRQNEPLRLTAIEIAPQLCAELYKQERGVKLMQRNFLTVTPEETGLFDAIVMNPPFHMRSDIAHIEHALRFLRPGGTLAALCMDTPHREKAFAHRAKSWNKIPAGAFKAEGTNTACVMLSITI